MLFGFIPQKWPESFKHFMVILLGASKKRITRKWLSQEASTLDMQMDITMDIYKMEKITALVNHKLEKFTTYWENWVKHVTPKRPDFIFTN